MTSWHARFSAWAHGVINDLRTPVNKDAYRILAIVTVLSALAGAAIGFCIDPRWESAMTGSILFIPGGLWGGALIILLHQRRKAAGPATVWPAPRRDLRWVLSMLAAVPI